jgi:hypothetical protein
MGNFMRCVGPDRVCDWPPSQVRPYGKETDNDIQTGFARPAAENLLANFPVRITPGRMAGVPVEEFTPLVAVDEQRVLIKTDSDMVFTMKP